MYKIIKNVIQSGKYELTDMLAKLDTLWVQGALTNEQRTELIELARGNANVQHTIDILEKLADLEARLRALEENKEPSVTVAEYVAGKWYYAGDKCLFDGAVYICVAPEGAVCTWSPAEYPAYWAIEA